jgi:ribosomal protein S18 acetylase RimI-like enzyme
LGTTYIFVNEKDGTKDIMGFITLRASSLILDIGETNKMGYPALEISELAVDERYEKNGVGSDLVKFAINLSYDLNKQIGIQYVVLCADPMAVGFYENPELKFEKIPTHCGKSLPRENWNKNCTPMIKKLMHEQHVDQNKRTA